MCVHRHSADFNRADTQAACARCHKVHQRFFPSPCCRHTGHQTPTARSCSTGRQGSRAESPWSTARGVRITTLQHRSTIRPCTSGRVAWRCSRCSRTQLNLTPLTRSPVRHRLKLWHNRNQGVLKLQHHLDNSDSRGGVNIPRDAACMHACTGLNGMRDVCGAARADRFARPALLGERGRWLPPQR